MVGAEAIAIHYPEKGRIHLNVLQGFNFCNTRKVTLDKSKRSQLMFLHH
jgi:hypothetical protein